MDDKQSLSRLNEQFIEAFRQGSWDLLEPILSPSFSTWMEPRARSGRTNATSRTSAPIPLRRLLSTNWPCMSTGTPLSSTVAKAVECVRV